jgi:transposase-like protein
MPVNRLQARFCPYMAAFCKQNLVLHQKLAYRCYECGTAYNLYAGTVFERGSWTPMQVVLFMRGICKGETTRELAAELELNYKTVLNMRHKVQANAESEQPETALPDLHSETDEMFQNSGEKR